MKPLYTQHTAIPEQYINDCFDSFLNEDQAHHDLSTQFSINTQTSVCAHFIAEEPLIFAGEKILRTIFKKFDIQFMVADGQTCMAGDILGSIKAPADILLSYERALLNLIQRLSGIAFLTSKYVKKLNSQKKYIPLANTEGCACNECPYMRLNTLDKMIQALETLQPEIILDDNIMKQAKKPLVRMLELSK